MFLDRWKKEYLHTLQARKKCHKGQRNISVIDAVLLKNVETHYNQWPLGRLNKIIPGKDNFDCKVNVRLRKDDKMTSYSRSVTDLMIFVFCFEEWHDIAIKA